MLKNGQNCMDVWDGKETRVPGCHYQGGNQVVLYNDKDQIVCTNGKCLIVKPENGLLTFGPCKDDDANMKWNFSNLNGSVCT